MKTIIIAVFFSWLMVNLVSSATDSSTFPMLAAVTLALVLLVIAVNQYLDARKKRNDMKALLRVVDNQIAIGNWREAAECMLAVFRACETNKPGKEVFEKERASALSNLSPTKRRRNLFLTVMHQTEELRSTRIRQEAVPYNIENLYAELELKASKAWAEHDKAIVGASVAEAQLTLISECFRTLQPLLSRGQMKPAERYLRKIVQLADKNSDVQQGALRTLEYFLNMVPALTEN